MFHRFRHWLLSRFDNALAETRRENATLRSKLVTAEKLAAGMGETNRQMDAGWTRTRTTLSAVLEGIELPADAITSEQSQAAITHIAGAHIDRLRSADVQRAERVEQELANCRRELADVRHELETTSKSLAVAEQENKRLWLLAELHDARIEASLAREQRRTAEARTATQMVNDDAGMGE